MKRSTLATLAIACLLGASSNATVAGEVTGTIYLLMPDVTTNRFVKFDVPNLESALRAIAPKVTVKTLNAGNQMQQQVAQMDAALSSGAIGVILVAVDPPRSAGMLMKAQADGVPVVTYAHDPGPGPVAYHVSVPFADIGEAQGKWLADHLPEKQPVRLAYMLGDPKFSFYSEQMKGFDKYVAPLVKAGKVEIVCRSDALLYVPANAQKNMEQCLTKTNNGVDAAVVMNDDTGGGVIAALTAESLQGKVPVYGGYDATLEGIQRVLAGWQASDMSPPYKAMADAAANLLISAIKKEPAPDGLINHQWDNGFTKGGVPSHLEPNVFITPDNVQKTVLDAGLYTKPELCKGLAASSAFCAGN
jgi:D-xylose transport system substrate-binding protein